MQIERTSWTRTESSNSINTRASRLADRRANPELEPLRRGFFLLRGIICHFGCRSATQLTTYGGFAKPVSQTAHNQRIYVG